MIKPIAIIVGAAVIWVASCLLLRKDKGYKTNEHNERKGKARIK